MSEIEGFKDYYFDGENVIRADGSVVVPSSSKKCKCQYRLKGLGGSWYSLSLGKVKALAGYKLQVPSTAELVPDSDGQTYIDIEGTVYRFTSRNPEGFISKQNKSREGYLRVRIIYKGVSKTIETHILMCRAFIMEDYIERGFCCLHKDDIKTNISLDNLEVGTYSRNNKDSYARGLNPGNGLKEQKKVDMKSCSGIRCLMKEACEIYSVTGKIGPKYSIKDGCCPNHVTKKLKPVIIDYATYRRN